MGLGLAIVYSVFVAVIRFAAACPAALRKTWFPSGSMLARHTASQSD
jgi:hypothetical protein